MAPLVHVEGGTGAGRKRPLREPVREPWTCPGCEATNPRYATRCLAAGCNQERPR